MPNNDKTPCVSSFTFGTFWNQHYPQLKVSRPFEDICTMWFIFANRKKCKLSPDQLFKAKQLDNIDNNDDDGNNGGSVTDDNAIEKRSEVDVYI